jgi:hypothetical protein
MLANYMLFGLAHQYVLIFCNYLFFLDVRDLGIDFFFSFFFCFFFWEKIDSFWMAESNAC